MTERSSDASNPVDAKPVAIAVLVTILLGLILLGGNMTYMLVPMLKLDGAFCPANTFNHGYTGSVMSLVAGFGLSTFSCFHLLFGLAPRWDDKPVLKIAFLDILSHTHKIAFAITMLSGVTIAGIIWWNFIQSYYCVTPTKILIRPSALEPVQSSTWDDVRVVGAHCWHGKYGALSTLVLVLRDGEMIQMPLNNYENGLQKEYNTIRTALWRKAYHYRPDMTVSQTMCPRDVYSYLLEWRGSPY